MAATPTAVSLSRSEHPLWTPTLSLAREGMRPGAAGVSCALDEARASRSPGPGSYFPEIKRASGHLVGHPPSGRTVPPRAADDDKGPPSASRSFNGPTGASRLAQTHEICRNLRPICLAFQSTKGPDLRRFRLHQAQLQHCLPCRRSRVSSPISRLDKVAANQVRYGRV